MRLRNVRPRTLVARTAQALLLLLLLLLAYAAAGLVGGSIPVNAGWRAPEQGVTIWVESNGIHTGLVMPKVAAGVDWRPFAPAGDLADPRYAAYDHLAIGWGEHGFYLGTPTWADVRPRVVLGAAIGSTETLLHVEHIPAPADGPQERRVVLRPGEYRRLAAYIRASLASRRHWAGYAGNDVFYEARGRYSAAWTCNNWTGAALRAAGVRVGLWAPFPVTVMGWFPAGAARK
ncbi:TIGR02117 family protein [Sphingomonas sp.]|uniref:TIGR02117 family protein n=1 Tax=Sphingomonas sp. TaxID=28214 RepID=UPI003CC5170B